MKLSMFMKKKYAVLGVVVLAIIFLLKRLGRMARLHPSKPKITFTRPVYITTSDPVLPIVNHADSNMIVYSAIITVDYELDMEKLVRCLDAIRDQKVKLPRVEFVLKAEIIVVHDGSSTELEEYIARCRSWFPPDAHEKELGYDCKTDKHVIRFLYNPVDEGYSGAMNFGIKHARGTWVLPLDVEDQLHPYFFAEVSLALDEQSDAEDRARDNHLSAHNPGKYNIIMPSVMDFQKNALSWQPSANTSAILHENMLHSSGMFLKSTWNEGGIKYSNMMMFGWYDWDFWIKLESQIGINALIVRKPSIKYNISHHRSGFCARNTPMCVALLHLNNPCLYQKADVSKSFKIVREYMTQSPHFSQWYMVTQEAMRGDAFAQMLVNTKGAVGPPKKLFSQFYRTQCVNDGREQCEGGIRRLTQLADAQEKNFLTVSIGGTKQKRMSLFHMIVTQLPEEGGEGSLWHQMVAHVVVGVLDLHPEATLVVHTDLDMEDIFEEELMQLYSSRLVSSPVHCHTHLAEQFGFSEAVRTLQRHGKGRPFQRGHFTDYLRFLLLYAFGGIYLDTDILLRHAVDHFHNAVALESSGVLNGAFMSFERYSPVMKYCLEQIPVVHDPFKWASIGPDLITTASKIYSYMVDDNNGQLLFNVLPRQTFYGTHRWRWHEMITGDLGAEEYKRRGEEEGEFGYHFRGSLFFHGMLRWENASSTSLLGYSLQATCRPEVMRCVQLGNSVQGSGGGGQ